MGWIEALVLGIVQGLTEFLPVSSSGHLEIAKHIFGVNHETSFYFTVVVHGATVLSTLVVFREEIKDLLKGFFKFEANEETKYVLKIFVSMVPVGIVGIFFKDRIEAMFDGNMIFVGLMLLVTATLLGIAHFIKKGDRKIGYFDAIIIGIAQAFATIPGISRSGATIATGLMIGNRKESLAKFSFLMVLIPVIGANLLEFISSDPVIDNSISLGVILTGFVSAFISGFLACKWMISLVKKSKFIWFSIYCIAIGMAMVLLGT